VQLVGVEVVRGLVLGLQAFSVYKSNPAKKAPPSDLWDHSLRIALTARRLAQAHDLSHEACEMAFLGGLLHDIGKIVILANAPDEHHDVMTFARNYKIPMHEAEMRRFGATHAQIGAYLLALWGIQDHVVRLVEHHHSLESFPETEDCSSLVMIHAAHAIESKADQPYPLNLPFLAKKGFEGIEKNVEVPAAA
jgi:putative nucleotidyltransferase with HDIG domain